MRYYWNSNERPWSDAAPTSVFNVVRSSEIVYTDGSGQQVTARVDASEEATPVELVTLVFPTGGRTDALELHIAWEITVGSGPSRLIYVDAVEGKALRAILAS